MTNGMDALGDPTRRAIFERLADGPARRRRARGRAPGQPPGGVAAPEGAQGGGPGRRTAPQGTRRLYQLDPRGIGALRAYFDAFWMQALAAFKEAVENPTQEAARMQATDSAVRREITVNAPPERAFAVFAEQFDTWWPRSHQHRRGRSWPRWSSSRAPAAAGTSRASTAASAMWGEVLAYDPPSRLTLSWRHRRRHGRSSATRTRQRDRGHLHGRGRRDPRRPSSTGHLDRHTHADGLREARRRRGRLERPAGRLTPRRVGRLKLHRAGVDAVAQARRASRGPSSNTWPRWPPQRLQTTSVRIIPCETSRLTRRPRPPRAR